MIGATGRMGTLIAREAKKERFEISGAVAAPDDPNLARTLREMGVRDSDTRVSPPSALAGLLRESDVCISFASAQAEMSNLPAIAAAGSRTSPGQRALLRSNGRKWRPRCGAGSRLS